MSDLARLRSGQSVADTSGAADLARRLAGLQVGQQLAQQQQAAQAASAQLQQQAQAHSDQNAVLMQLLTTLLARKVHFSMHAWQSFFVEQLLSSCRCCQVIGSGHASQNPAAYPACFVSPQEAAAQQQQPQQLPPGLEGQAPSSEALAALYQQLSSGGPQGMAPHDIAVNQQVILRLCCCLCLVLLLVSSAQH